MASLFITVFLYGIFLRLFLSFMNYSIDKSISLSTLQHFFLYLSLLKNADCWLLILENNSITLIILFSFSTQTNSHTSIYFVVSQSFFNRFRKYMYLKNRDFFIPFFSLNMSAQPRKYGSHKQRTCSKGASLLK